MEDKESAKLDEMVEKNIIGDPNTYMLRYQVAVLMLKASAEQKKRIIERYAAAISRRAN